MRFVGAIQVDSLHAVLIILKILRYVPCLTGVGVSESSTTGRTSGMVVGDLSKTTENEVRSHNPECKSKDQLDNGTEWCWRSMEI